jgi:hypothetical protein
MRAKIPQRKDAPVAVAPRDVDRVVTGELEAADLVFFADDGERHEAIVHAARRTTSGVQAGLD